MNKYIFYFIKYGVIAIMLIAISYQSYNLGKWNGRVYQCKHDGKELVTKNDKDYFCGEYVPRDTSYVTSNLSVNIGDLAK